MIRPGISGLSSRVPARIWTALLIWSPPSTLGHPLRGDSPPAGVCAAGAGGLALCQDPCPSSKSWSWGGVRGSLGWLPHWDLGRLCSMLSVGGLEPQALLCPLAVGRAQGPCPCIPSGSLSSVHGGGTLFGSPVPLGMHCPAPHLRVGRALCQGLSHCGCSRNLLHSILTVTCTPSKSSVPSGCVSGAAVTGSTCI